MRTRAFRSPAGFRPDDTFHIPVLGGERRRIEFASTAVIVTLWSCLERCGPFLARACEQPFDAAVRGISLSFPGDNFGEEGLRIVDSAIWELASQHAGLDLGSTVAPVLGRFLAFIHLLLTETAARLCSGVGFPGIASRRDCYTANTARTVRSGSSGRRRSAASQCAEPQRLL